MNIIKSGNTLVGTQTCPKCGCEFTYTKGDRKSIIKVVGGHKYVQVASSVKCPECTHEIDLGEEDGGEIVEEYYERMRYWQRP